MLPSHHLVLVHDGNVSNRNQARALGLNMDLHYSSVREINLQQEHNPQNAIATTSTSLIIGCGHKASRFVCQFTSPNHPRVKTVQILHPRFPLQSSTSKFDCLVIPQHDEEHHWFEFALDPNKVVKMNGSLGWNLDYFSLLRYRLRARGKLQDVGKKTLVVLMGGSLLHPELWRELESAHNQVNVEFVTSRRSKQIPNRANNLDYREALAVGDYFAVDADSISMVADVLSVMSERNLPPPVSLFSLPLVAKHSKFLQERQRENPTLFERCSSLRDIIARPRGSQPIHFPNEAQRVGALVKQVLKLAL
ncbi:hypothetical protein BASA81_004871 [Batrachochytrium salamandrivorans]|nr:hypothetical protein BASA81_004871 [Batrachochytrium salamandrivorans]